VRRLGCPTCRAGLEKRLVLMTVMRVLRLSAGWLLLLAAGYLWWSFGLTAAPNPFRAAWPLQNVASAEFLNWTAACLALLAGLILLGMSDGDADEPRGEGSSST